ncbi:MAG TPA: hypothetical protein VFL83_11030 [Anaeromyxobacter sp.]|nr:hypothetical protein [Anaeromyxobacter sp.]
MSRRALSLAACLTLSLSACGHDTPGPAIVDQDTALEYGGYASGWTDCWQSFTAGRSGFLTAVRVWAFLPPDVALTLYEGEGISGGALAATTSLVDLGADRWEAALPGVPLTAGWTYTIRLTAASDLNWIVGTNDYAGGLNNVYGGEADFGVTTYVR